MFEWTDEQLMIRDAVRQFVDKEIKPNLEELEHGDTPPYDTLRKLFKTFGMDAMAAAGFDQRMGRSDASDAAVEANGDGAGGGGRAAGIMMIPIIELSRYCPAMMT